MRWVSLDGETNILNTGDGAVGTLQASPYSDRNKLVALGETWLEKGQFVTQQLYDAGGIDGDTAEWLPRALRLAQQGPVLVVGHNIGFDLAYLAKTWPWTWAEILHNIYIWDTQQVEYLISGQSQMYPSLDEACDARGYELKDEKIKEYWKNGIDTAFIPKDELLDYLKHDTESAARVFLDQYNEVTQNPALFQLVKIKMDDLLMTTMMSMHGMKFDLMRAAQKIEELDPRAEELYTILTEQAKPYFPEGFEFTPGSPEAVGVLLFGGEVKMVVDAPVLDEQGNQLVYKSGARAGQGKTRKEKQTFPVKGMGLKTKGVKQTKKGYSTDDETLSKFNHPFVKQLLEWRGLTKDIETYYRGYSSLVWPDGIIRPQRNHESTATGRLSCSSPNLENVSKGED